MKRVAGILQLLVLLLALLCLSCQPRKSAEEKEQLLRLKQARLNQYGSLSNELAEQTVAEIEELLQEIDNDSLLCAVRWDIFRVYQTHRDTASALRVLEQQKPLLTHLYGAEVLHPYYHAISLIYGYYNEPQQSLYWLRQARPQKKSLFPSWYNRISEDCLKAGRYKEALLYADSGLACNPKQIGNSVVSIVKGEALIQLFRKEEALRWYASAIQSIDSTRMASGVSSYSQNQQEMIYRYAALLHQTAKTHEAIRQLTKIMPTGFLVSNAKNFFEDINNRPVNIYRLLSDCYYSLGNQPLSHRYIHQADSLQAVINKIRLEARNGKIGEQLQNQLLKEQLQQQLRDNREVRKSQYTLFVIILLLLAIIIAGIYGRRKHQKRLQKLFFLLTNRHTLWLEQHYNPVICLCPHEEEPPIILHEEASHTNYQDVYQRVLRVMQKEKPFLNPALDLNMLARYTGTNRTMLSTSLNRETGMNFSNWLAEYRVNFLIEQLPLLADKSMNKLFQLAGFSSRTSFFRQFRQVTGMTPSQYLALQTKKSREQDKQ